MIHRGEHSEITTVLGDTVDSEVSGNMIDLCPVGALTSKPFRYSAAWELSPAVGEPARLHRRRLIVQVKNNRVMRARTTTSTRCWLADRDRFYKHGLR